MAQFRDEPLNLFVPELGGYALKVMQKGLSSGKLPGTLLTFIAQISSKLIPPAIAQQHGFHSHFTTCKAEQQTRLQVPVRGRARDG